MKFIRTMILTGLFFLAFTYNSLAQPMEQNSTMYQEPFRPQFHYSPPCRWMNDPNGMVYDNGEYHLFYQFHPFGETWGPMHWGHAVSPDLVHWTTLPIALYPDDIGTIWSGSAVIDSQNTAGFGAGAMVAIYSYDNQSQGVAYSTDHGRTWTKYADNPVIPALAKDFRDPKVFWHEESQQWVMIISMGHEMVIFSSPNLLEWTQRSSFSAGQVTGTWEVPDLFPLEVNGQTKWVMIVSVGQFAPAGGSGMQYFIGSFDGQTFVNDNSPSTTLWFDWGADDYAGTTWDNAPDGRRIYIGWMNNWVYANSIPTSTWRGATTLPRELKLVDTPEGIRLQQTPVAALEQLRQPLGTWDNLALDGETALDVQGRTFEITAEFEAGTAERFGLIVHNGAAEATRILYNPAQAKLLIGRSDVVPGGYLNGFTRFYGAPLALQDGRVRLHLYVDESSVEVFANDGLVSLTSQTFVDPQNTGLSVFADGGTATLTHLEINALASIWTPEAQQAQYDFCS